jgi:hypothetical protein
MSYRGERKLFWIMIPSSRYRNVAQFLGIAYNRHPFVMHAVGVPL